MTALSTVKKSKPKLIDITNVATQLISVWCQRELRHLGDQAIPPILSLTNGSYLIGHRRLVQIKHYWQLQAFDGAAQFDFSSKRNAVFYCLAEASGDPDLAVEIQHADQAVAWLQEDLVQYQRLANSSATAQARLKDCEFKLLAAKKRLQNSINQTKYMKS